MNGRIKTWKYLDKTLPNTQIPYIGDYVRIISALCNKFRPAISTGNVDEDIRVACKMKVLRQASNILQQRVDEEGLDKRSYKWVKMETENAAHDFPQYTEEDIRELTLGVYQLKLAKSYTQEHLNENGEYDIFVSDEDPSLLCAKIQSRHISAKKRMCWIGHENGHISSWYCKCKSGARVVGTCAHVTSVIWYLAFARHTGNDSKGVRDWTECLMDASNVPVVDDSDTDSDGEPPEE